MKNKLKPTVTYMKNGEIKTETISWYNKTKISKEIFREYENKRHSFYCLQIDANIEFVHFQNCQFHEIGKIESFSDSICIFENCTFNINNKYTYSTLYIDSDNIELINPNVKGISKIVTDVCTLGNIKIILDKKMPEKINLDLYAENLTIINNDNIECLRINAHNISLSGTFNDMVDLTVTSDNTTIKGTKLNPTIITADIVVPRLNISQKLILSNCIISDFRRAIKAPDIKVDNVTIKSSHNLNINDSTYYQENRDSLLTITDLELSRTNFISILKGYKNLINQTIEQQSIQNVEENPTLAINALLNQINEQEQIVEKHYEEVTEIKHNLEQSQEALVEQEDKLESLLNQLETAQKPECLVLKKYLSRKPIKYISNKNT